MWTDLLPKLKERFDETRQRTAEAGSEDDLLQEIYAHYDMLCLEMVEGLQMLFVPLIENQVFIRSVYPEMDKELYIQLNISIVAAIQDCLAPDVDHLPEFYFRLHHCANRMETYCRFLKDDILYCFRRRPDLLRQRRFRQTNLQINRILEGLERLHGKSAKVSSILGGQTTVEALHALLDSAENRKEILDLLAGPAFSKEERELIATALEDNPDE